MGTQIKTDYINIENKTATSTENIENIIKTKFNNILRWAIVSTNEKESKICVTYEDV